MPRRKTDRRRRTIFVSDNHWSTLDKMAEDRGLTVSDIVREAIAEYLKKEK